jgi:hypothetical protein
LTGQVISCFSVTDFDPDSYKVPALVAGGMQNARTAVLS